MSAVHKPSEASCGSGPVHVHCINISNFAHRNMYTVLLFILIGETLRLRGYLIPTDGSGRIVITDINPNGNNDVDALICQSELSTLSTGGNWFLHPTQQTTDDSYRIYATDTRGWHRNRVNIITAIAIRQLVRLRRDDSIASGGRALEGVFTCDIPGDRYTSVSVGIYYPSESHVECHLLLQYILLLWFTLLYTQLMHSYLANIN